MDAAITVLTESRTIACALPAAASTVLIDVLPVRPVTGSQLPPITMLFVVFLFSVVRYAGRLQKVFAASALWAATKMAPHHAGPSTCVLRAPQTLPSLARD